MTKPDAMPLEALPESFSPQLTAEIENFSPYAPIADYAFLSDCEVTALVAPSGAVEWMCLPRMDSPERVRRAAGPGRGHVPVWPG